MKVNTSLRAFRFRGGFSSGRFGFLDLIPVTPRLRLTLEHPPPAIPPRPGPIPRLPRHHRHLRVVCYCFYSYFKWGTVLKALRVRDLKLLTLALQPLQEAVAQLTSAVQLLGEQVDLTGGREGLLMAAADGEDDGEEEEEYGNAGGALAAAAAAAAQQVKAVPARKTPAGASAGRAGKGRGGTAGDELGPLDRETAVSWLLGGMLPLHAACVEALAYRAAWLGMDIGPGWHWPQEQPIAVPASTAALRGSATATTAPQQLREGEGGVAVIAVEDGELEEQQAEAMAELIGSLASYVDVIAQARDVVHLLYFIIIALVHASKLVLLPGSEIHTQAAARLLTLSRRYLGPMDRVAGEISTAVYDAHVLRYGKLDEDTFERLLAAGMEAMAAARRREAELRPEPVGGGDGGEYDGVVEGETEDLEELFLEDQRLREEAHAAAAAAAAAVQPPRSSWPLGRGDDGQAPRRVTRAATPVVRQQQQQQLEEEEDEEEEELPDGVTVARGPIAHGGSPPGARGGGGGGGGGGSRRRAVLAEAEQDLLKVLDSSRSRRSVPSVPSGASAPPRMRRPASVAPREAAAEEEDADRGGDDVAAATVRRLLRRDEAPRAGLSAEGYDNGAAAAADVNEEEEEEEEEAGGGGGGGRKRETRGKVLVVRFESCGLNLKSEFSQYKYDT
ncbi:hypothetical protein VOLCADRAFT_108128 [Volvox carteri f. nagariensis]|uniref:Uncharacterized protein n=1 Tax=Volvox carteri f. nagariensis TaxID=3068 RepID=D8UIF4_VOLCA|nr:uncharacterized protein VOLCADRAFT_108128 [Volvox carteri f. nagariensis]EFJ40500.1 hypothetical protein VOLCADRAFT_108128 [Volvox carteri f. nagariensis]|eukprot:XP_002958424.1 hypothetical protein VOLCADRAFT_108128 [Volvox carteri f. nagariensis]